MSSNEAKELFPTPPESLRHVSIKGVFRFVGPGLIIASVTIGSGELVWASRSGAVFGYAMLWCFLAAGVFKAVQVYSAARHITLTGEHPMMTWMRMPGPRGWFPILIMLPTILVMPIAFSGISEILGGYLLRLMGPKEPTLGASLSRVWAVNEWWINVWGAGILTLCFVLSISSSLSILERVSAVVLSVMLLCVVASVLLCQPNLMDIVVGMVLPRVPDFDAWVIRQYPEEFAQRSPWLEVAVYLTAVGGGTYDYVGYVGMLREKRWGLAGRRVADRQQLDIAVSKSSEQLQRARSWVRAPLYDTTISFALVIAVTLLFAVLGAAVLNGRTVPEGNNLLQEQEKFVTAVHAELRWVYRAGVLLAFVGTLYGAFEIYQHTVGECVRAILPRHANERNLRRWSWGTLAYCFGGGLVMIWLPTNIAGDVVGRMTFGAIIGGATLCGAWCFAMLWADKRRVPEPLQMSRRLRAALIVSGTIMIGLGLPSLWAYFR